jgi:hypothetical protein
MFCSILLRAFWFVKINGGHSLKYALLCALLSLTVYGLWSLCLFIDLKYRITENILAQTTSPIAKQYTRKIYAVITIMHFVDFKNIE